MKSQIQFLRLGSLLLSFVCLWSVCAQSPDVLRPGAGEGPSASGRTNDFEGPPPFGPPGFGPGGPGGMMPQGRKLVKQFDEDGDKRLNAAERKAAREFLKQEQASRGPGGARGPRGGFFPGGPGGRGGNQEPPQPGPALAPSDVKNFTNAPLYDPLVLRTLFIEFEDADWEKELAEFNNSDVDVPAKLTVDGRSYADVGVHFRGASSFMMVPEGRKRSLNVSMDFVHGDQNLDGFRTLNLLNSHEDPSYLRTVLFNQIAREYVPAPKANFVRVVINGECWGVYVSAEQFNRDFIQERFGTTQGARWKVPGSPGGRGGLEYIGEDPALYRRTYEIKTRDDPKAWRELIHLCRVLNTTPADRLEEALAPLLDIDGALKFLALENALINNDGYWIRASDYSIYQDVKGRFHVFPHDANETFSLPGGPGFGGGPGGRGGFGPGMFLAPQLLSQADQNDDRQLTKAEFVALADSWYDKLDPGRTDGRNQDEFVGLIGELLPPPQGFGPPGGGSGGPPRGGMGPATFIGPGLFSAADANTNGILTRAELKALFSKWFTDWDAGNSGSLNEEKLRTGLSASLPRSNFTGPGGGRGPGGPGGGGGLRVNGVELDPLVATNDTAKPLLSKLLAAPGLRARYLTYVREIAATWLDWNKLGPIAEQYHALIADAVKVDTRKLDSTEAFQNSLTGDMQGENSPRFGPPSISLKSFADKRRAYLLKQTVPVKSGG